MSETLSRRVSVETGRTLLVGVRCQGRRRRPWHGRGPRRQLLGQGSLAAQLALEAAIGHPAEWQTPEIAERAQGQDLPRIADEQRYEQHGHNEDRQHHLARYPPAEPFARIHREPRY